MRYTLLPLILLICTCGSPPLVYQFTNTNYSNIHPKFLNNAYSVVHENNTELVIEDASNALYRKRVAITILDEEHDRESVIAVPYDQLSKVNYMNARLINKRGEEVRRYSMKDASDFSQFDGFSFFSDNRLKVIEVNSNSYPYTIEYEYEKKLYGTLNLPSWAPIGPDQSVILSSFLILDNGTGVRTHPVNFDIEPSVVESSRGTVYNWTFRNQLAKESEPYSVIMENIPYMLVSPGQFQIEGSSGDASTWESFGKWYYDLGANTRELPKEAKLEIDALVEGIQNQQEIVHILFDYLQRKNRYVSIQLGIGGWKPFPAQYVFNNSYGDCKALTNYMLAALEYVGITANAVLINATGSRPLIEEFSGNQFNHVILRVVLDNGVEIWLECTSKYLPPNNLGDGYGKKALLVSKDGGEIVSTPEFSYMDNAQISTYEMVIDEEGSALIGGELTYSGADQSRVLSRILSVSEASKVEWLENQLEGDTKKINSANFEAVNSKSNESTIVFNATLSNYANTSSKRLFIPLNKLNRWRFSLDADDNRELPFRFIYPFYESDTISIQIPEGYKIEAYPRSSNFSTEFAEYQSELSLRDEHSFTFKRSFKIKEKEIEANNYNKLRDFLNNVRKADLQQLVLVKNES